MCKLVQLLTEKVLLKRKRQETGPIHLNKSEMDTHLLFFIRWNILFDLLNPVITTNNFHYLNFDTIVIQRKIITLK